MNCVVCNQETQSRTKNVPCCSGCRTKVYEKRDELTDEKNRLRDIMNGTLDQDTKGAFKLFHEAPNGTVKNALIMLEIERNDKKIEKAKITKE